MAGQTIGGIRNGNVGQTQLGLDQNTGGQSLQIQQLAQKILEMLQGGKNGGAQQAGGGQQAGGAQQGQGAGGESLEEMFRKLVEMAQQNPAAFRQAMQNPAVQQVMSAAFSGGGGAGAVGKA